MATKKATTSRAAKMREYFTANPTATPSEVAKKFKTTYQVAYMCKRGMQPKKLILERSEVALANKLGISTTEYANQKAKILKEPKRKPTKDPLSTLPKVGDSVGGMTLTREEDGQWVYRWVKDPITMEEPAEDPVNHPAHYTEHPSGVECIQITEHMNFCLGNAIKYIWRAELKGRTIEDLEKAIFYVQREINRRKNSPTPSNT
jgi:hypothetical protein